jgi:O-antigen ligase
MIMANPILGVGLNNSTETMRAYTLSTTGPATTPNKVVYRQPIHSYFLSITAEVGLVGAALLLGFFISNCRAAFRLTRSGNPDEAFYAAVAVVSIIGLGTQLAADPMADIPVIVLLWFFCGFIAGLAMARFPRLTGPLVPAAPQGG